MIDIHAVTESYCERKLMGLCTSREATIDDIAQAMITIAKRNPIRTVTATFRGVTLRVRSKTPLNCICRDFERELWVKKFWPQFVE